MKVRTHLMNPQKFILLFLIVQFAFLSNAQQDFNEFKTLVSKGTVPADFTISTSQKIKKDLDSKRIQMKSSIATNAYVSAIHSSIDELLQSGYVVFGDDISIYVQQVAENLLAKTPELQGKFRYYTIKSNETNALSTDQGIIFVTTGLISQLTSEAQLAYVLAHEISHYTEHHVQMNFEERLKNSNKRNRISKMSSYSKELELSADKLALKLFNDAGYSFSEIEATFDVLMYSYLPFDDVAFPKDYFNNPNLVLPETEFGTKTFPIKAVEDYNDELSSHPNIKKRKTAIRDASVGIQDWGTSQFIFGEERFNYIRNVARFESLRTNIIDVELSQALYSIFLLEQEFKESTYLKHMKALTWLSMLQLNSKGELSGTLPKQSSYEGESAILYYFVKSLKSNELIAIAIRQIYELQKAAPDDQYLKLIYEKSIEAIAQTDRFKFNAYSTKPMDIRKEELKQMEADTVGIDSVTNNKYNRIKSKTNVTSGALVDTSNVYLFSIPDIVTDEYFISTYKKFLIEVETKREAEKEYRALSKQEKRKFDKEKEKEKHENLNVKKLILVEPSINFTDKKQLSIGLQEKHSEDFRESIARAGSQNNIEVVVISSSYIKENQTDEFNERNTYYSFLNQSANYQGLQIFPVDFERLNEYTSKRGTSTLLFTDASYDFSPTISPLIIIYSTLFFPTLPITLFVYIPINLMKNSNTEYSTVVLDTKKGDIITYKSDVVNGKPRKLVNEAYYYKLLSLLNNTSK